MRIDIIGSLIITLFLMLICNLFHLGFFSSILLMIFFLVIFNYRGKICLKWWKMTSRFAKKEIKKEVKSSYDRMEI